MVFLSKLTVYLSTKQHLQIAELKNYFVDSPTADELLSSECNEPISDDLETSDLFIRHGSHVSHQEILAALPPKPVVDRLVTEYFSITSIGKGNIIDSIRNRLHS